jgi:outer membrane putative beta-barrel porin/alpha-amylase
VDEGVVAVVIEHEEEMSHFTQGRTGAHIAILVLALLSQSSVVCGQALEPRSYTNIPIDQTFVLVGYIHSEGELTPTTTSPLQDANLDIDAAVVGMAQTFELLGRSAKIDLAATRQCFEGSATFRGEFVEGRRCGYGDPNMRLSWNFYGAPALELADFAAWQPGLVMGASVQVSAPVGTYKDDAIVNIGSNRWMVRPGLGLSYQWDRWHIDAIASVRFFEDNDDYFEGLYVKQDPIYAVQSHLIYSLRKGRWIALNANFFRGGETNVDGVDMGNRQENSRFGITFSMPISRHNSVKLYANTGVITRIGNDFDTFGAAWQYRF